MRQLLGTLLRDFEARPQWMRALLLAAVCLLLTFVLSVRTSVFTPNSPDWSQPYDHHKYIYMAEQPVGSFHINPTCWRIAVPLLVGELPLPTLTGFRVQTFVFIALTGLLLYFVLQAAGYSTASALLGIVMFYAYGPATKLLLADPYSPDPASFVFSLAALYFLLKERDIPLALTLALGVTVKETIVLLIPLIYTIRAQRVLDWRLFSRTILVALPALAVLFAIRAWIPAYNTVDSYVAQMGHQLSDVHLGTAIFNFRDAFGRVMAFRLQDTPVNILRELTFGSVGLLWVLPFFGMRAVASGERTLARSSNLRLLVRFLPFLGITYLGWFVALNTDRRLASAFPIWIMLSLNGVRSIAAGLNIDVMWFLPAFLVQYFLNLLHPLTPTVPFDLSAAVFLISLGALFSLRDRLRPEPLRDGSVSSAV
jgi:hypothetical protein